MKKNEILPAFKLPSSEQRTMGPGSYRQRKNLLLIVLPEPSISGRRLIEQVIEWQPRFQTTETAALAVVGGERNKAEALFEALNPPFPFLFDSDLSVISEINGRWPSLLVADRYGMVWDHTEVTEKENAAAVMKRVLETLEFINLQCPECGVLDSPPP